jgi:uracil-DNA glycosylase family 4
MIKNLVHLCGGDASGKSTIAKALCNELEGEYTHFDKPNNLIDGKQQYLSFLKDIKRDPNDTFICDRFHDGEWVYAPIYRGYKGNYLREIEGKIVPDNNYLLVYVKAKLETIKQRISVRGEDFVKEGDYEKVIENYKNNFLSKQGMPFINIDTTNIDCQENVEKIKQAINKINKIWDKFRECYRSNHLKCKKGLKPVFLPRGNVNAKYMILGQNPGGRGNGLNVPTCFIHGKTSKFLNKTLKEAGIYYNCWFSNIVQCSTKDNKINNKLVKNCIDKLKLQLDLIQPDVLFVLGNDTYKYLQKNIDEQNYDVKIIKNYHPTYIKRFYSNDQDKINNYINSFKVSGD